MKKITVMVVMLFVTGMLNAALGEAIVTLKSGAVLRGEIISDTNDVLQIRAFNSNRTISSLRNFPRSDVQNVQIETPAEAAERIDYFALGRRHRCRGKCRKVVLRSFSFAAVEMRRYIVRYEC